ncbi:ATP-dependent protease ATPase subunit HslU [Allofustis seminis]|uniref:ATP-dependent protease ATPase subunit HslU n=1 Tax=Allofustis seminis TaxID=166939 RepID=UPI0003809150|nr:ATP-dependent protease ATPase subunit HslU [Allofustis seminis]
MNVKEFTPKEIVQQLDQYIVGQHVAKRAVAIALRNRYRRLQIEESMKKEITPKNILMIGPTGVGKTEIARRLADLMDAPFVKVEATKFTEVGYVGRDVESMVRDLVEVSIQLVRKVKHEQVRADAFRAATNRLAADLVPAETNDRHSQQPSGNNPFAQMMYNLGIDPTTGTPRKESISSEVRQKRETLAAKIRTGQMDQQRVTIHVEEKHQTPTGPMADQMEQLGIDLMGPLQSLNPPKMIERDVTVAEAVEIYTEQEADRLIQSSDLYAEAIALAENSGIIFLDEIDKITATHQQGQAQISREGVQRDILPIVEGSVVKTKYGNVRTDYILFIGSGAFHLSKPSDLIPELQGRFPIRVELEDLTAEDFVEILTKPKNSLIKQYQALLATEDVHVQFTMDAIEEIADIAFEVNRATDNIGARRLYTVVEKLLEDLLFEAGQVPMGEVQITKKYVEEKLESIIEDQDLSRYIL